ncbi:hypothetical protein FB567DRAFT_288693 [Paraphoma chrysanthemicola]|uniref:Zn(2)-C6 fungal-type domain-containing protein n=1 Tax=Paraphoma chrysanthemicola TaxID=798071 RepID=A0A8K0W1T0_9PLEO|nr:hypothetical protein FB567DRAFT_288693 [Paraphoma chrysanthemicola]
MPDDCTSVAGDEAETRLGNSSTHKRRRLNTVKCDRCRRDKQRCDPVGRIWPEKCDRCASKNLPCSEGKKAGRVGKQDLDSEQDSDASESGDTDANFQKLVSHWMVLSRYRKNLSLLSGRLQLLWLQNARPFKSHGSHHAFETAPACNLVVMTTEAAKSGLKFVTEALMNSNLARSPPQNLFPMFLEAERPYSEYIIEDCKECICTIRTQDPYLRAFSLNGDVFGEFLTWQRVLLTFMNSASGLISCTSTNRCIQKAMNRYCKMAKLSMRLVVEVLKDLGKDTAAEMAPKVGLYQPEAFGYYLYEFLDSVADIPVVLDQNALQQWLDFREHDGKLLHKPSLMEINEQDLLGRSSLHIACLRNNETVAAALLEQGANTNARTTCGRTALHFAAANNNIAACEKLLEYCGRSQIEIQDAKKHMARDYTNRPDIVKLLDTHAGRSDVEGPPARESSYTSQLRASTSAVHDRHGPEGGWERNPSFLSPSGKWASLYDPRLDQA